MLLSVAWGKYNEAIKALDRAIELDPKFALAWANKGYALYKQEKYDEAIEAYNKTIELNPENAVVAVAWNFKGLAFYNLGAKTKTFKYINKSLSDFDKAIELNSSFADPWYNNGNALDSLRKVRRGHPIIQ